MEYNYVMGMENSSVRAKIRTPQFKISEKLLDKRYELDLTLEELANITKETLNNYLKMEYADYDIPVERYIAALNKIYSYQLLSEENIKSTQTYSKENSYLVEIDNKNINKTNIIRWSQAPLKIDQVGEPPCQILAS